MKRAKRKTTKPRGRTSRRPVQLALFPELQGSLVRFSAPVKPKRKRS